MRDSILRPLRHLRLRWKFVLLIGGVIAVIAGFFLVFLPVRIERLGSDALAAKARVVTEMTAASIRPALVFEDSAQIGTELRTALLSGDVMYAVVLDADGRVAGAFNLREAVRSGYPDTPPEGSATPDAMILRTRMGIIHQDMLIGTLYMGYSRAGILAERVRVRNEAALVTAIVFAVGFLAVIAISALLTADLQRVVATVRAVTAADLSVRAPEDAADEVGDLARAFNATLDRLEEATRALESANRELEDRVALRTGELEAEVIEHRRTEESLRLSEERQRQIIDVVPNYIFVKDAAGRYLVANEAMARFYGTTVDRLQAMSEHDLAVPEAEREVYLQQDRDVIRSGVPLFIPETTTTAADGSVHIVQIVKIPVTLAGSAERSVLGVATDITALKTAERELKASLNEKEVLLKEVHHRVKNNLQVINSLLNLQAYEVTDPGLLQVLRESQGRIRSMAMVHEQLYSANNLAGVDFREYLTRMSAQLLRTTEAPGIRCTVEGDHLPLAIDAAVPCGLIVNELISNALKHAFNGREGGMITVCFRRTGASMLELSVSDDGVGVPPDLDIDTAESMGMTLVNSLVRQIHGTLVLGREGGSRFVIRFPSRA